MRRCSSTGIRGQVSGGLWCPIAGKPRAVELDGAGTERERERGLGWRSFGGGGLDLKNKGSRVYHGITITKREPKTQHLTQQFGDYVNDGGHKDITGRADESDESLRRRRCTGPLRGSGVRTWKARGARTTGAAKTVAWDGPRKMRRRGS